MAETGQRVDPFAAFNFVLDIDGIPVAGFSECTGVMTDTDIIPYRNGNEDITVRKLPGLKKFGDITLKRGLTASLDLWTWRKTVLDGKTQRKAGTITLLNEARQVALKFHFREGWPSKWEGPGLNAKNNEVAIETLVIAHEGLDVD